MQRSRSIVAIALVSVLAAACGGSSATQALGGATQGPGAATQNPGGGGGGATEAPAATQSGGGGGGGGGVNTANGKIHIELRGPIEKTVDLGFVPAASIFGSSGQVSSLNFSNDATNAIATVTVSAEGAVLVTYGAEDVSVPGAQCTTSNWNIGATSASGSFDCNAALAMTPSGALVQGVTMKGTFDAHT
jgi:hypothetical protein